MVQGQKLARHQETDSPGSGPEAGWNRDQKADSEPFVGAWPELARISLRRLILIISGSRWSSLRPQFAGAKQRGWL